MIIGFSIEVDTALLLGLIFTVIILIFYLICDVHYFITKFIIVIWCKIRLKRVRMDETTTLYGICTTNDLDIYFHHMNNARYVRELDFARFHFYKRTGIYDFVLNLNGVVLHSACHIRYRKTIPLLTPYKVTTRVIYWDKKHLYLEHQFIQLSDGFITTVILSKQAIPEVDIMEMMNILTHNGTEMVRPDPPPEFEDWIHLNKKSSARMRNSNLG